MKKDLQLSIILCFLLLPFLESFNYYPDENHNNVLEIKSLGNTSVRLEYGIPADFYSTVKQTIRPNQFLSDILTKHNVPSQKIAELVEKSKGIFDLRRIKVGNLITAFKSKDKDEILDYLVYEATPTEFVVFDLAGTIKVSIHQKEIQTRLRQSTAVIESSLWNAMVDNDLNPELCDKLSDIYAWSIDFFGLQEGDFFKVIYEEKYVDDVSVGIGKIKAASFYHANREFYAFPFNQDSTHGYFDEEGKSLKKAFLKAPLKFSHITSGFTSSRLHPVYKVYRAHYGVDYAASIGTPVYALGDGVVLDAGYTGDAGRMIRIRHNSVYTTAYLHLNGYASGVSSGAYVRQGQIIGYVGSSGASTGPHLDFRCWKNGFPINPATIEAPPVEPIKDEYKTQYFELINVLRKELEKVEMPLI